MSAVIVHIRNFIECFDRGVEVRLGVLRNARTVWDSVPGSTRFRSLIDRNEVEPIELLNESELFVSFDPDSAHLQPYDGRKLTPEQRLLVNKALPHQAVMNGFTKAWNTLLILMAMTPDDDVILRMFKHYMITMDKIDGGKEPLRERKGGTTEVHSADLAYPLRLKTTLNFLWQRLQGKDIPDELWIEWYRYFFRNPSLHSEKMKKMKYAPLSCIAARSSSGCKVKWSSLSLDKFEVDDSWTWNDESYFLSMQKEVETSLSDLAKAGLPLTRSLFRQLISAEVNERTVMLASFLHFLEALTGYMRMDYSKVFLSDNETNKKKREEALASNMKPAFANQLAKIWAEFLIGIRPMDEKEWKSSIPNELTTRSAGLNKGDVQSSKVTYPSGSVKEKAHTSKTEAFFFDPERYIGDRGLERFNTEFTDANPGNVFRRNVMARPDRPVMGGTLVRHLIEVVLVRPLMRWQAAYEYRGRNAFTLTEDTGRVFTDHREWMLCSGNGSKILLLIDFSRFDQSQMWHNVRGIVAQVFQKYIDENPGLEKIQWNMNFAELILRHWKTLKDAVFWFRMGAETYKMTLDQLLSGEFITLAFNNMTNIGFIKMAFDEKPVISPDVLRLDRYLGQGDDVITTLTMSSEFMNSASRVQAMTLRDFRESLSKAASDCGLELSAIKSCSRRGFFEFLKKSGLYGWQLPRYLQINMNEVERIDRLDDPVSRMQARVGLFREFVVRGGNIRVSNIRMHIEWTLVKQVKMGRGKEKDEDDVKSKPKDDQKSSKPIWIDLPIEALYAPLSGGGVGILPDYFLDPNVDLMIQKYDWPPEIRLAIDRWVFLRSKIKVESTRAMASEMLSNFKKGVDWIRKNDDPQRVASAMMAYEELKSKNGIDIKDEAYHLRYERAIRETLQDSPSLADVKVGDKIKRAQLMVADFSRTTAPSFVPDAIREVRFELLEEVEDALPFCPVAGLDASFSRWIAQIGTSAEGLTSVSGLMEAFRRIMMDNKFPKNLKSNRPENIAQQILQFKLKDPESIARLLVAKGAEPATASLVAVSLAQNIEALLLLSDLQQFSMAGEGYTNKTLPNLLKFVELPVAYPAASDIGTTLLSWGFMAMRTQPLYRRTSTKTLVISTPWAGCTYYAQRGHWCDGDNVVDWDMNWRELPEEKLLEMRARQLRRVEEESLISTTAMGVEPEAVEVYPFRVKPVIFLPTLSQHLKNAGEANKAKVMKDRAGLERLAAQRGWKVVHEPLVISNKFEYSKRRRVRIHVSDEFIRIGMKAKYPDNDLSIQVFRFMEDRD